MASPPSASASAAAAPPAEASVSFPRTESPPAAVPSSGPAPGGTGSVRHYQPPSGAAFSSSAARRQSVMALPSIEHLQHQYAKLGLSSAIRRPGAPPTKPTLSVRQGWSMLHGMSSSIHSLAEEPGELHADPEEMYALPPSPVKPEIDTRQPWEREGARAGRSVKDEKSLRRAVFEGLELVCDRWSLVPSTSHRRRSSAFRRSLDLSFPTSPGLSTGTFSPASDRALSPDPAGGEWVGSLSPSLSSAAFHGSLHALASSTGSITSSTDNLVYDLIQITTEAVRTVQTYVVALPPDAFLEGEPTTAYKSTAESEAVRLSTASRPRPSAVGTPGPESSEIKSPKLKTKAVDGAQRLRTAGLDVLGALKDLERRHKIHSLPTTLTCEGEEDAVEDVPGLTGSVSSGSLSTSASGSAAPHLGEASEYATDVKLSELKRETEVVRKWVEVVDRVLLRRKVIKRGRPRRGASTTGDASLTPPEVEITDELDAPLSSDSDSELSSHDELPLWADPGAFSDTAGGSLAHAHILIAAHLSPELHERLPKTSDRLELLYALSDGVVLCHAYNTVLRVSSGPFGFIPQRQIHLLPPPPPGLEVAMSHGKEASSLSAGAESGEKVGQIFRRVENLRVFVAALRFRYHVALPEGEWDPKRVARRETGWDDALEAVVGRWVAKAAEEKREELEEE